MVVLAGGAVSYEQGTPVLRITRRLAAMRDKSVFGVWCLVLSVWCLVFGVECSVFGDAAAAAHVGTGGSSGLNPHHFENLFWKHLLRYYSQA